MKAICHFILAVVLVVSSTRGTHAESTNPDHTSIPFSQLGEEAQKQYAGDGIGISPTTNGAWLRAAFQQLEGNATSQGLWLESTAEATWTHDRFRVLSTAAGRANALPLSMPVSNDGKVTALTDSVVFSRPGLLEEYRVSMDGVRQDFVVLERPSGEGELVVRLEVSGAAVAATSYGASLQLSGSGRLIAYSRLLVTDACGRELAAHFEVADNCTLNVKVDDTEAAYPVRIDPTFSDADWISMGGISGVNGGVNAIAIDGSGNVYIGGSFTIVGDASISRIAKWNGSSWSGLGAGIPDGYVATLAVSGTDIYAGGSFTTAGGVTSNHIARWNGSPGAPWVRA